MKTKLASASSTWIRIPPAAGPSSIRIFEGEKVRGFVNNQRLSIKVSCKEGGTGKCVDQVPYALAVTLEVAEGLDVPIYQEIADRIRPKVEIAVNPGEIH